MPWNPDVYHKFQSERSAPFRDLMQMVAIRQGLRVIDLGCGTGELTRKLADSLPGSDVVGVDNSPEMLGRAQEQARSGLRFELVSVEEISGKWDLIFSHATLQWVEDHHTLIPRLFSMLQPQGQLAVQVPSNQGHITHRLITEIAGEEPFRQALNGWTRKSPVLPIDEYAEILYVQGGHGLTIYEKIYPHVLGGPDSLAEWTSGTALVPYFERMSEEMRDLFMDRYRERLRALYPQGSVFYGFRRTLFAATRT